LNKIIFIILFLVNTLLAITPTKDDVKVLTDLGIEASFIYEKSLINAYNDYSSSTDINYYRNILRKSSLNVGIVKNEIDNENLPDAVMFIPMLESNFVNQSRSKSSPGGLWQIIPETATNLKLRNDEFIDERLDVIKSTDAASSYLKRYYKKLDKWYLAILAYNCGEGRVIEAISRASLDRYLELNPQMSNNPNIRNYQNILQDYKRNKSGLSNLYDVYEDIERLGLNFSFAYLVQNNKQKDYLPENSIAYIQKIIAFSIISNRNLLGDIDNLKSSYKLEKVKAPNGLQLKSIADAIGISSNELSNINKHIKKQVIPSDSRTYSIYIPQSKLDTYNNKIGNIRPSQEIKNVKVVENKNSTNETKKNIVENKKKNIVENKKNVVEVKKNIVETKKNVVEAKKNIKETKKQNDKKSVTYTIKKGDTLESIAKANKIDLKKLKADNKIKSNKLTIGDKIEIYK